MTSAGQPWTDEAKYQLLLRIVAQLREGGRPIDWQKINMPGRTPKSLQNTWFSIKKAIAEMEEKEKDNTGESPAQNSSPRKRGPVKSKSMPADCAEDDEESPKKMTSQKRGAGNIAGGRAKRVKREPKNDPEGDDIVFKTEMKIDDYAAEM